MPPQTPPQDPLMTADVPPPPPPADEPATAPAEAAQVDNPAANADDPLVPTPKAARKSSASSNPANPANPANAAQTQAAASKTEAANDPLPLMDSDEPQMAPHSRDRKTAVKKPKRSIAAAPAAQPTAAGGAVAYTVKPGDTLMKIAFENYGSLYRWREIYENNRDAIKDPSHLDAGTPLKLQADRSPASAVSHVGAPYLIEDGDNLGKISGKVYNTRKQWKTIWHNNEDLIHNPNEIYSGFTLYYPPLK
jgi:nucleoid-associated protein YgaU